MDLDGLGDAIVAGAAEIAASSLPSPPHDPGLPPPPPTTGQGDRDRPPSPDDSPERRGALPVVLAIALVVLVGTGAFALASWAGGGACGDSDFRSDRFGYCASAPAGWIAAAAEEDGTPLDRFVLPDGPAVITVIAVPLAKGQDLARFEQFVRGYDEDAGATTSASTSMEVDGVDAVAFDATLEASDSAVRSREVLFARDGIAWRVTLADEAVGFEASTGRLGDMLESWRFT